MQLREIEYTKNVPHTIEVMGKQGLLLTTAGEDGAPNTMTIGWGNPGIIWGMPIFIVYVRPSRFTFRNMEASGEFVVSVPTDEMKEACTFCGTKSGRDVDKFAEMGFTTEPAQTVDVPLIGESVRHYECKVVHYNDVSDAAMADKVRERSYASGNLHRVYYGEILRTTERT